MSYQRSISHVRSLGQTKRLHNRPLAGKARFRPILLTTFAAVVGLSPMAIKGSVLFQPLAITIISGLLFSMLLTLIVVPSLYTVVAIPKGEETGKKGSTESVVNLSFLEGMFRSMEKGVGARRRTFTRKRGNADGPSEMERWGDWRRRHGRANDERHPYPRKISSSRSE
ncbi:efflux RND transporter permease subunit [Brevibacillus fortis]|uniref:efflux RND transporter permease subunit n=1 Tax=Brevibacillus fortis TaxID=2126352 RepID=UPI0011B2465C|nr:efflux RND transporter permease subunit [Brevibacillus fortis]